WGLRLSLEFVCVFGCFGFIGGRTRWLRGLGGQEEDGEDGACCGDAAGDEGADGEAAQERAGGRVVQCLAEGGMAGGGDLAGGRVGGADGRGRDRGGRGGHGRGHRRGEP